jgi:hypothetical protein
MERHAELSSIELPEFGLPREEPELPAEMYRRRLLALSAKAQEQGIDVFFVYADREHSANLSYLTGYDPRFEEAASSFMFPAGNPSRRF